MKRVIVVGSPRSNGRSAHLAEMLFEANIDERPEDELYLVPVSEIDFGPCIACDGCKKKTEVVSKGEDGAEVVELKHRCVFDDDMQTVYDLLDEADEFTIVSPIFFSGAPAPMKALLDRLQPYFWANARKAEKRPATLHVIGEGGDPHGHAPLVSEVKSALAVAGFRLERVFDWVGKIDEQGEILEEAEEEVLVPISKQRPKLDLSGSDKKPGGKQSHDKGEPGGKRGAPKGAGGNAKGESGNVKRKAGSKQQRGKRNRRG